MTAAFLVHGHVGLYVHGSGHLGGDTHVSLPHPFPAMNTAVDVDTD